MRMLPHCPHLPRVLPQTLAGMHTRAHKHINTHILYTKRQSIESSATAIDMVDKQTQSKTSTQTHTHTLTHTEHTKLRQIATLLTLPSSFVLWPG